MPKLRILAVEDQPIHASKLEMVLDELGYQLLEIADNATEALRLFKATKPDLVLMDIGLKDDDDGVLLAEKFNNIHPVPIIFTTSFTDKETFERAKATEPYAYMIKPIEKAALQASVELAVFRFAKDYLKGVMEETNFTYTAQGVLSRDCFFVKSGSSLDKIRYNDVLWIAVSSDRYCEVVTNEKSYSIRASLKSLEEKLPAHQFVRSYRTHIVNIFKVDSINEQEMTLTIGMHRIPLGQSSKQVILDRLNIF